MSKVVELEAPSVLTMYVPVKHGSSTYIKNTIFTKQYGLKTLF